MDNISAGNAPVTATLLGLSTARTAARDIYSAAHTATRGGTVGTAAARRDFLQARAACETADAAFEAAAVVAANEYHAARGLGPASAGYAVMMDRASRP
jgi:hypothetical protein